jgi:hypothetical protein
MEAAWASELDFGVDCCLVGVEVGAKHKRRVRVSRGLLGLLDLVVVRGGGAAARGL